MYGRKSLTGLKSEQLYDQLLQSLEQNEEDDKGNDVIMRLFDAVVRGGADESRIAEIEASFQEPYEGDYVTRLMRALNEGREIRGCCTIADDEIVPSCSSSGVEVHNTIDKGGDIVGNMAEDLKVSTVNEASSTRCEYPEFDAPSVLDQETMEHKRVIREIQQGIAQERPERKKYDPFNR